MQPNFPLDIKLTQKPLVEAWLTIQWQLEKLQDNVDFYRDVYYDIALGRFYNNVQEKFATPITLEANRFPSEALPYVPRQQFRTPTTWPLLQLGPGVATLNFTQSYTWPEFKDTAMYLREKLVNAYEPHILDTKLISLRYKDAFTLDSDSTSAIEYLSSHLNTTIRMPEHIPGFAGIASQPDEIGLSMVFHLSMPKGRGTISFSSGKVSNQEVNSMIEKKSLLLDIEVVSIDNDSPSLYEETSYSNWLDNAHLVCHEWFFSIIDGKLFGQFSKD